MTFNQFVQKFPEITLPISVTEDTASAASLDNEPLSQRMIDEYLLPIDPNTDEMTEFVPCFRIPNMDEVHALCYWKAGLLNYQYILATFQKNGVFIDSHVIAGTLSDGVSVIQSVARIDEYNTIYMVSGMATNGIGENYEAIQSRAKELELLSDGRLIELA